MIKNKAIAGVLLVTMLLSGIPEGFGAVSKVYADEPVASVETVAEPESGEQTPEIDDLDEADPSKEEKKIIEEQGSAQGQGTDEKSSDITEVTDKKENNLVDQVKDTNDQESVTPKDEKKDEKRDEQINEQKDQKLEQADDQKKESEKDDDSEKPEKEYPAFKQNKTVNGVTVTVEADEGVFPENAKLSVTSVSSSETEKDIKAERDNDQNVAVSYTFDIKILDEEDNELQPAEDQNVKVSFRTAEVADPNLEVSVYHVSESGGGAEELDVDVSGQTAVSESDGFSYYTVEFTYNDLQYVLNGDESVALSEILSKVGLLGEATDVKVSNSELFSASKENGKWVITSHKAFSSDEWMRVTIGDITYEIIVTDDPVASGDCGNGLTWALEDGTLTISKTGDGDGKMTDWNNANQVPWYANFTSINNVVIGAGVTSIGEYAFKHCNRLTNITIPTSVTSIGRSAFDGCQSLTGLILPPNLGSIEKGTFRECYNLTSIAIPTGVTSIGSNAFIACSNLESVAIPTSVTSIGTDAFKDCSDLNTVYYQGDSWESFKTRFPDNAANITRVSDFIISDIASHEYDGTVYNPVVTVKTTTDGPTLEKDSDYTLSYQKASDTGSWDDVNASDVKNAGTYRLVVTGAGTDYAVLTTYKQFNITQKRVTITAQDASKTYDGSSLTNSSFSNTDLPDAHTFTVVMTADSTITNAGEQDNVIATVDGVAVTTGTPTSVGNYLVTTVNGTLTVNSKDVTITAKSEQFTYDGTAHSYNDYDVDGLVGGDALTAVVTGSITTPSESPKDNVVESYQFTTGTAGNYTVTKVKGALTMVNASKAITITAASDQKTYDGTALTNDTVTVTNESLFTGDRLVASANGSVTNVGDTAADNNPVAAGYKIMHGSEDVTGSYVITTKPGTLTITPKAVTVTAQDKAFTYDGKAHSWPGYDVTGLVGNDSIKAKITGSISSISQTPVANVVDSYEFKSGTPSNYTVTTQNGQLTMTENPICTITFYANNGTGATSVQDVEKGTTVSFKPNGFSYTGHTFKEWNDKEDGSGKSYKDQVSIPVNADMSLYAQWTENEHKTYSVMVISLVGGTAEADKIKGTEGETVKLSAKADKGYGFKEWKVEAGGVDLSDKKSASATFKIKTADVKVKALFEKKDDPKPKKEDSDDDDHGDEPNPNNNVKYPDGFDELRGLLNNAASSAKATGLEQIVTWDKGTSLPYDVMKMLQDNPKVTLVFSYTYQDHNFRVTIPGSAVIANPSIPWYGPLYLYMMYGDNKMPGFVTSAGTYTVKSGDTLSAIAKRLKTTQKHLKDVNNIKNVDKIKPGMVLKY